MSRRRACTTEQAGQEVAARQVGECICGADEPCTLRCDEHDRTLHGYPCGGCTAAWEAANPRTAAAISRFASGKGSKSAVDQARRAEANATPAAPRCVECGSLTKFDEGGGRWVHYDPAVSLAVDHAARIGPGR